MGQQSEDSMFDVSIYADAHDRPSLLVPTVRATPETLVGFGRLVPDYDAEQVTRVTWPKAGWRSLHPGTGNHQVRVMSSLNCTSVEIRVSSDTRGKRNVAESSVILKISVLWVFDVFSWPNISPLGESTFWAIRVLFVNVRFNSEYQLNQYSSVIIKDDIRPVFVQKLVINFLVCNLYLDAAHHWQLLFFRWKRIFCLLQNLDVPMT